MRPLQIGEQVEVLEQKHLDRGGKEFHPSGLGGTVVEITGDMALVQTDATTRGWYPANHLRAAV